MNCFDPTDSIYMRGFDGRGANAFIHSATSNSLSLSGTFVDVSDFVVLVLKDKHFPFGYRDFRPLPTTSLENVVLTFDLTYNSKIQGIDGIKSPWIPWNKLSWIKEDGTSGELNIYDHATKISGGSTASATYTLLGAPGIFDHITFFYRNTPFDHLCGGAESLATVRDDILAQINAYNWPVEGPPIAIRAVAVGVDGLQILAAKWGTVDTNGTAVTWKTGHKFQAASGVIHINGTDYTISSVNSPTSITLTGSAGVLADKNYTTNCPGEDGNSIEIHCRAKNTNLYTTTSSALGAYYQDLKKLSGGVDNFVWRVSINFTTLGIDDLRQCWLTMAPRPNFTTAFAATDFDITISNISITDPDSNTVLKVPHRDKSVQVSSKDVWATYSGAWSEETGFYYLGYAKRSSTLDNTVTIAYSCQHSHDVYLGTYLYTDQGKFEATIDGGGAVTFDNYLNTSTPIVGKVKLFSGIAAGDHTVVLRILHTKNASSSNYYVYFDNLHAVVETDPLGPSFSYSDFVPGLDLDTDRTYKLPPQKTIKDMVRMGYSGDIDFYKGVFFTDNRVRSGGTNSTYTLKFNTSGAGWAVGDYAEVVLSGITVRKTLEILDVDGADTSVAPKVLAKQIASFLNETFAGIRASASGDTLTIVPQTWSFAFTITQAKSAANGSLTASGNLNAGTEGTWIIDDTVDAINYGATAFLTDFCTECMANGFTTTMAASMEFVNPPEGVDVWAARYSDGSIVTTSTGFGSLVSTHCAFNTAVLAYQKKIFLELSNIQDFAGMPIKLQFGEWVWWFFNGGTGPSMAFYDVDTKADALVSLGRDLNVFVTQDDDPSGWSADLSFLSSRLKTFMSAVNAYVKGVHPTAQFENLFPYDVLRPTIYNSPIVATPQGGRINYAASVDSSLLDLSLTPPFDLQKLECLSYSVTYHDLDLIKEALEFLAPGWPALKYLMPIFNAGCCQRLEYLAVVQKVGTVNTFDLDHYDLFGWKIQKPR